MSLTILTYAEMARRLTWHDAVDALRQGHRLSKAEVGDLVLGPSTGHLLSRAAHIRELGFAVKAETVMEGNAAHGLPTVQGSVLLYEAETGCLQAVIESRLVTEFKTAADSILGATILARADSRTLLVVGTGAVAASLIRGYTSMIPGLRKVFVWGRRPDRARDLVAKLSDVACELVAVEGLEAAASEADIVSAATMAREPLLFGAWIRPGTHVDLIGAYLPDMREADDALVAAGSLYVDSLDTTLHIGDIAQPLACGVIGPDHILGDLYDLVRLNGPRRRSTDEITIFKNGGGAHLDLMTARYIQRVATTESIGESRR